jgi:hydrogenase-4 component F
VILLVLLALPLAASALAVIAPPRLARVVNLLAATATAGVAVVIAVRVLDAGETPQALAGYLRADGLAALVAIAVAVSAAIGAGIGARSFTADHPAAVRTYTTLSPLLTATLLVAALADHLGLLWISLELAAVVAAFLIGSGGGRVRHEAALKYMLLGSAGLVLGLLATAVAHKAARVAGLEADAAMSFQALLARGDTLAPGTMRIALALAAAGYGLKVGLFPLHVWKPDAYTAAPAAVTATLAGGAVLVPLEALVRFGELATAAGEGAFASQLFVAFGLVSMVAALFLMVPERDLRRILAFTSVEHLGLILLACGIGGDVARGGLVHLVANGLLKALAFGLLGLVLAERGSCDSQSGAGLYRRSFGLGAVFLVVMAASLGLPPFGMFTSELVIVAGLFAAGHTAVGIVVVAVLAAIFGFVAAATLRVVFARSDEAAEPAVHHGRAAVLIGAPVLAVTVWIGVAMPEALWDRLGAIAAEIAP